MSLLAAMLQALWPAEGYKIVVQMKCLGQRAVWMIRKYRSLKKKETKNLERKGEVFEDETTIGSTHNSHFAKLRGES